MIKVSICCITYNHAPFIRKCLDGFLMQQCDFEYEILIHDDASNDGTIQIIEEYACRYPDLIKPVIQRENQFSKGVRGINAKFNFPRAKGEYLALCEGDDYWTDSTKLQKQIDFLDENPSFFACFHHRQVRFGEGEPKNEKIRRKDFNTSVTLENGEIIETSIPTLSLVIRNDVKDYNALDHAGIYGGDVLLRSYIATKGKVRYLHFYGGVYRKHTGGIFSSLERITALEKSIKTREIILERLSEVNKKVTYRSLCKIYYFMVKEKIKKCDWTALGDVGRLAKFFGKSIIS